MATTRISRNAHPNGDASASDVVDVVCPTGEHGGGEVAAGRYGDATCTCGRLLVALADAPPEAAAAVKAQRDRLEQLAIPPNVLPTPPQPV